MNIVKLVILFCDHCVFLCNMCKRFGILPPLPLLSLSSFSFTSSSLTVFFGSGLTGHEGSHWFLWFFKF